MWTYLLGPFLALLPREWREGLAGERSVNWPRAAFLSGIAELVIFLSSLIGWYFRTIHAVAAAQYEATLQATQGVPGHGAGMAIGAVALFTFLSHPVTWVLAYFSVEGLARSVAAAVTDEAPGTLPLVLVDRAIAAAGRRAYEARVPVVHDVVVRGDGKEAWDLMVSSCRPKPTWRYPTTIEYENEFFQVFGSGGAGATPARPHVYLLRRPPPNEAYRGVEKYSPMDVVESAKGSRFFLADILERKREEMRLRSLPLVADEITRADGAGGWHIKVNSCRPKPEWTPGRTIRFQDQLYRLESTFEGSHTRPFGFRLRLQLPTEAARGMLDYSSDEPLRLHKK